jgi:hypothetical protein
MMIFSPASFALGLVLGPVVVIGGRSLLRWLGMRALKFLESRSGAVG